MDSFQKKAYARKLIEEHAGDIEYMTIFEMAEDWADGEISEDDADDVRTLISKAKVEVSW